MIERDRAVEAAPGASWEIEVGPPASRGNSVEFLIDNEAAWGRLAGEIAGASVSIRAMLFMLDVPHVRLAFEGSDAHGGVRFEDRLLEAANRGVDVTILLNHVLPAISPANTTAAVEAYFRRNDRAGRVRLARLVTPQAAPIHAKIFVVDDRVAYLIGSGFAQEYFDGRRHLVDDRRRGQLRWRSSVKAPVHDVSARVEGPAVADLDEAFRLQWRYASPKEALAPAAPARSPVSGEKGPVAGEVAVQVTRTLHGNRYPGMPAGETGIYESYRRALDCANEFIYLETQYFTCVEIVDALVAAMLRRPQLQLIALVNMRPDIPGYVAWQAEAIERLVHGLGDAAPRAGIFTLWSHEPAAAPGGRSVILRTHVHSKLAIVDDAWLTIGSANLDGTSLLAGEHARRWPIRARLGRLIGAFGSGDPKLARSTEVNIVCGAAAGAPSPPEIARLRRELWAEHLGLGVEGDAGNSPELSTRPEGGWLSLWRRRAAEKLAGLTSTDPLVTAPRVLPYPVVDGRVPPGLEQPHAYLRALGIRTDRIDVRTEFRSHPLPDDREGG